MATGVKRNGSAANPAVVLIAGWAIPGLGHLLLKKYWRALFLFVSITVLFVVGLAVSGKIYLVSTDDILDKLGFVANIGNPVAYLIALMAGWGQQPVVTAVAEYGTKFIVAAGLLNVIAAVDAHSLANGRKAGL